MSFQAARAERERMRRAPVTLERPVLVIAGYRAWMPLPAALARALRELTGAPASMFAPVAYPRAATFEQAAEVVLASAEQVAGAAGDATGAVDVVAVSMGGLVTRYLASALWKGRRLDVRRLITLSTPHRGANLAKLITLDPASKAMKPGSTLLAELDAALAGRTYELTCYTRLRDWWVGSTNCAPPGMAPIWLPTPLTSFGHLMVSMDERLIVEVARRLRGEEPFGKPGQPPPSD